MTVYPYGKVEVDEAAAAKKIGVKQFHTILKARKKALAKALALEKKKNKSASSARLSARDSSTTSNIGLALGYNPSTGYIPTSTCFNETTLLSNGISVFSFNSSGASSSFASQTNASASISANYESAISSGTGNAAFTYANSFSKTGSSGSIFFNAFQLYTANNTFIGLNGSGLSAQSQGLLSTNCGTNFVTSIPVGMLITGQASYYASTQEGASYIESQLSASANGGTLASFSAAVQSSYNNSTLSATNAWGFGFTTEVLGGGEGAAATYTTDMAAAITELADCVANNNSSTTCPAFVTNANDAALNSLSQFETDFGSTPTNLGNVAAFPNGISGAIGQTPIVANESVSGLLIAANSISASDATATMYSDTFSGISTQISNYLSVLNEITTLYRRAMYLGNTNSQYTLGVLSTKSSDTNASGTINPSPFFDIEGTYLSTLIKTYGDDMVTMQANLTSCLEPVTSSTTSATDTTTNCAAIINAYSQGITSAYAWYSSDINGSTVAENNFELQNTIALQYTGQIALTAPSPYTSSSGYPVDVMWTQALPIFSAFTSQIGSPPSPAPEPDGLPGLIAFADQTYRTPSTGYTDMWISSPYVLMMPAVSSSITTISGPTSNYSTYGYTLGSADNSARLGWQMGTSGTAFTYYGNGCSTITYSNLCSITTTFTEQGTGGFWPYWNVTAVFSPISNFFR